MLGNAKALIRNNGECKGILIGPSMAPRFLGAKFPSLFSSSLHESRRRLWVKFRGADGKPMTQPTQETRVEQTPEPWQFCRARRVNNLRGTFGSIQ